MSSGDSLIQDRGGELYGLLLLKFPTHRSHQGLLNVPRLAKDAGLSHETGYRAVRGKKSEGFPEGKLTVSVAVALLELSRKLHPSDPLYAEDLVPFVIPNFEKYSDPKSLLE